MTTVYIFQSGSNIKVGVTSNSVYERLKAIQTGCPYEIDEVFYALIGTRAEAFIYEKEIHSAFKNYKTQGEWFLSVPRFQKKAERIVGKEFSRKKINEHNYTSNDNIKKNHREKKNKLDGELKKLDKVHKRIKSNPLLKGISMKKLAVFADLEVIEGAIL